MAKGPEDIRDVARKRIKSKKDFTSYLFVWLFVSILITAIWFFTSPDSYFWPGWAIGGMAVAVPFIWWDAYGTKQSITDADIDAELKKMGEKP